MFQSTIPRRLKNRYNVAMNSRRPYTKREIRILKEHLRPWLQQDTWFTDEGHDEFRFYESIASALWNKRKIIGYDKFRVAMLELVDEHHGGFEENEKEESVRCFARRAADIERYVRRTVLQTVRGR